MTRIIRSSILLVLLIQLNTADAQICVGDPGKVTWECWRGIFDDEIGELTSMHNFPKSPDITLPVYKVQSPVNFDNDMGGKLSGFISVPSSDTVVFNITGDDKVQFYLSSDDNPANKVLLAYTNGYTNIEDHTKYPEQTTDSLLLEANLHYYFELIYAERTGGDHATLYWKTDHLDPVNWQVVPSSFIHDIGCLPGVCPETGSPCDDGDPSTVNDMEDGHCHCFGEPVSSNTCIGERAAVTMYTYTAIPGSSLNDLYADPNFPAMPVSSKVLDQIAIPQVNETDSSGTLIQGYLTVPVTGDYKFNVTGNNETIFFLSSDDTPENKQAHQILVIGSSNPVEHDKYIYQTTSFINLASGQYYYFELNHKEASYTEHFNVFWQTPYTESGVWKRIPDVYLYDYTCTLACIPQGSPCDDGDPFTNNDMYDNNCQCTGIPCTGDQCDDPIASYAPYPKCDMTDQLDNNASNNWLSCTRSANPNPQRGLSHWIKYDLGEVYQLFETHVWNYNVQGATNQGFQSVAVDYSEDGNTWYTLGNFSWSQAPGTGDYSGFIGPDFIGKHARHVLITSLDNPNNPPCRGFGKIVFTTKQCLNVGAACDDGDPLTANDTVNVKCECIGEFIYTNECQILDISLGDTLLPPGDYSAIQSITSENLLGTPGFIVFIAGQEINLNQGFEVPPGAQFLGIIESCPNNEEDPHQNSLEKRIKDAPEDFLRVLNVPETDEYILEFVVPQSEEITLEIKGISSDSEGLFFRHNFQNKGIYTKRLRTVKLTPGVHHVVYRSAKHKEVEKMVVF